MIHETYLCDICRFQLHYHPAHGLDGLTLYSKGPVGAERSVLERDADDWKGDPSHTRFPRDGIHICRQCETGLRKYFTAETHA